MKKYLLFLFSASIVSCSTQRPIQSQPPFNNQTYNVEYLFEHAGCKVYRFYDRGNYVYFTNCNGETITKSDSTEVRNSIKLVPSGN